MLEMKTRLGSKLRRALRPKAPLLLKKLTDAHPAKDSSGTAVGDDAIDGVEVWKALKVTKDEAVREYDEKRYEKAYEAMRDVKLKDNASPAEFSTRINTFTTHVNP